jgi:hypothetical protein
VNETTRENRKRNLCELPDIDLAMFCGPYTITVAVSMLWCVSHPPSLLSVLMFDALALHTSCDNQSVKHTKRVVRVISDHLRYGLAMCGHTCLFVCVPLLVPLHPRAIGHSLVTHTDRSHLCVAIW